MDHFTCLYCHFCSVSFSTLKLQMCFWVKTPQSDGAGHICNSFCQVVGQTASKHGEYTCSHIFGQVTLNRNITQTEMPERKLSSQINYFKVNIST